MPTKFDKVLEYVGPFGRYQKSRFALLSVYAGIVGGWSMGVTIFLIMVPSHQCRLPPRSDLPGPLAAFSDAELGAIFVPREANAMTGAEQPANCRMRTLQSVKDLVPSIFATSSPLRNPEKFAAEINSRHNDSSHFVETCPFGWSYDAEDKWSIVAEFDLVCSRNYLASLLMTINSVGGILGTIFFAFLQDKIGRRPALMIALVYFIALSIVGVFMPSIEALIISTTLRSVSGITLYQIPYVLSLEMVRMEKSTFVVNAMSAAFSLGFAVLPLVAWLCQTWKQLIIATTAPCLIFLSYYWLIDESPRWLLAEGKEEESARILAKMAKINRAQITEEQVREMIEAEEEEEGEKVPQASVLDLFRHKRLAAISVAMAFIWCVNAMVYIGITLNTGNFGGNAYVVFTLVALIEIPAELLNLVIVEKLGRIWPSAVCMLGAGLSLVASSMVPQTFHGSAWLVIALVVLGKFCITASFCTLYQLGGELFPTVVRASGLGFATTMSQIMSVATPFIVYAGYSNPVLPMLILGGMSIAGGMVCLLLPETLNTPLPDTIPDMRLRGGVGFRSLWRNLTCQRKDVDHLGAGPPKETLL